MSIIIERLVGEQIPLPLLEIPKPPTQLYIRGELPFNSNLKYISIVGSRNYTRYGADAVRHLIKGLAGYPVVIVSGLAIGMDTLVHECALEYNIPTLAFPGSGLSPKVLYPARNRSLVERILASGGALVSELEPEQKANIWTFPARNRLMAGIADMVVIIEAEPESGTRITANLALEYNKLVGAVPGSIFSESSKGCHALLKLGAIPITSSYDILRELGIKTDSETEYNVAIANATELEIHILNLLSEPMSRNDLARELEIPMSELISVLGIMELKSLISEEYGEIRKII